MIPLYTILLSFGLAGMWKEVLVHISTLILRDRFLIVANLILRDLIWLILSSQMMFSSPESVQIVFFSPSSDSIDTPLVF
jgi:hypothetical protein